jgi:hypothetical protein
MADIINNKRYDSCWEEYYYYLKKGKEMTGLVRLLLAQTDILTFDKLPSKYVHNPAVFEDDVTNYHPLPKIHPHPYGNQAGEVHPQQLYFRRLGKT